MAEPSPAPADGLAAGLAAEYALIYAYGVAGAEISGDAARSLAGDAEYSHRDLRDRLTEYMAGVGQIPPPPEAAYTIGAMEDEDAAVNALIGLEDATAATWRTVITTTTGDDRRHALAGLSNAAARAALWRRWLGEFAGTTAFPGG